MEAAGELVMLKPEGEQATKKEDVHMMPYTASSAAKEELAAKEVKKIHETVKLFWRTQEKIDIGALPPGRALRAVTRT